MLTQSANKSCDVESIVKELNQRTHDLGERVKELECLYSISKVVEKEDLPLNKILQQIVEIIPPSWQYPEITCARIRVNHKIFQTEKFAESPWFQSSPIYDYSEEIGLVEVFYLEEMPESAEGPFLKEERKLLNDIAERIGGIIALKRTEQEKAMLEKQLCNTVLDGIVTIDTQGHIMTINESAARLLGASPLKSIGSTLSDICGEGCKEIIEAVDAVMQSGDFNQKRQVKTHVHGQKKSYMLSVTPLSGKAGTRIILVIRDITRLEELEEKVSEKYSFSNIIGKSASMQHVFEMIKALADTQTTVLIQGATGTGKELVASALHYQSSRSTGPFVKLNCAALPENLLESELFGHVRGAFTGATHDKMGRFELAHQGTIFLDEIGDVSPYIQQRLLRVLQEREIERVGSNTTVKVDVRVIAASNRNLSELVASGTFREDLFYRLNVVSIQLPSLHERREDIPELVDYFLKRFQQRMGRIIYGIDPEAMEVFLKYHWPGNVRQLQNTLENAIVLTRDGFIHKENLPSDIFENPSQGAEEQQKLNPSLSKEKLLEVLKSAGWNRSKAARRLGISRTTMWRKIKDYQLQIPID